MSDEEKDNKETPEPEAAPKKKPKAAPKPEPEPAPVPKSTSSTSSTLVYIGPGAPQRGLSEFAVFRNGVLPPHVERIRAELPALRSLFVPIENLASARAKLASAADSAIKIQFKQVQAHFNGGGE